MRTVCPGLGVLEFKYSAAPTRCTTETTVGTGLPNHCLHQAYWFYFLNSFISSRLLLCACSYLFEDFDCRLSQFPQINFFSLFVFFLVLSCVYAFCTLCLSSSRHDDYACILLCLLLSTYSAASSSSFRNFLTSKFLSEEFIKISYSPPSSRYNALSSACPRLPSPMCSTLHTPTHRRPTRPPRRPLSIVACCSHLFHFSLTVKL